MDNKNNLLIIFFLIVVLMLFIGSVSANDVENNNCSQISIVESNAVDMDVNPIVYQDVEQEDNSVGNFTQLKQDIANGDSIITLKKNYKMLSGETHVDLSRSNLIIDGEGHTLDASGLGNVFGFSGTNVTFKNITFINGYSVNGGVIGDFYGSGKNYTVIGCTFINNTATNCGGALYSQNNPYIS